MIFNFCEAKSGAVEAVPDPAQAASANMVLASDKACVEAGARSKNQGESILMRRNLGGINRIFEHEKIKFMMQELMWCVTLVFVKRFVALWPLIVG